MKQLIAISAIGNDRTGLVYDLTRVVVDCGGNILESRMTALGNEFAMLMLVAGNWHTLAKLEGELAKLAESSGLSITSRRTELRPPRTDMVSYSVDVVCLDQPGILHALAGSSPRADRHRRHQHAQLQCRAHGCADVLRVHGGARAHPDPHCGAARRIPRPVRSDEPGRDPRTAQVVRDHA
jgi:predicted amino acid-binding ACT domain protein